MLIGVIIHLGGFPLLYVHSVWTSFVKCILTLRVMILVLFDNSAVVYLCVYMCQYA